MSSELQQRDPSSVPDAAAVRPNPFLLAAIAAGGTLAMHIFVPALPEVARQFDVRPATAQLTLTLYLIGIALGQLVYGPLSDRFGRRPVLIVALWIFLAGTVLAGVAPGIEWLIAARVLQAIGACGGLVLGRAMVRDGAPPDRAARQMALLVMAISVAPALAPLIGGTIAAWLGWRAIFAFLGTVGVALLAFTLLMLPETHRQRVALPHPGAMIAVYARLLALRDFRGHAAGGACMSTSMYAFFASSPFLFVDVLHRPASEVGAYYMVMVAGVTVGSWMASRLTVGARTGMILPAAAAFGVTGSGRVARDRPCRRAIRPVGARCRHRVRAGRRLGQPGGDGTRHQRRCASDRRRIRALRISADGLRCPLHVAGWNLARRLGTAGRLHPAGRLARRTRVIRHRQAAVVTLGWSASHPH